VARSRRLPADLGALAAAGQRGWADPAEGEEGGAPAGDLTALAAAGRGPDDQPPAAGIGHNRGPDMDPLAGAAQQAALVDRLRTQHLAREDGLPLEGPTVPITPPPHIQTAADMQDLVGRYADLAQRGQAYRDWYTSSGRAILGHAGDDPEMADKFAGGLAATSPRTDVAGNTMHAITMHNQAMVGDPLSAGAFPQSMGPRVEGLYYSGNPLNGLKIEPFMGATAEEWNPNFEHSLVNDTHNMRALEYPGVNGGGIYTTGAPVSEQFSGKSVPIGAHNFARVVADLARDELERRTGIPWTPKQAQAASWVGVKSLNEGKSVDETGADFARGLARNYAQLSWESAPGQTTGHLPEYFNATPAQQQLFHDTIRGALTDDQGRDLIAQHLGLLTGPTLAGPGVFKGQVSPGAQAQVAAGRLKGTLNVDPATRDLLTTSEAVRGLLLRQDAFAWHKPVFRADLSPAKANMADVNLGRTVNGREAEAVTEAMAKAAGTDFFSPIATENGFRFHNVPASGVSNKDFFAAVDAALQDPRLPDAQARAVHADGGYLENDWRKAPHGQSYLDAISGTGRPDLSRRAAELLATLGPRISEIEEDFHNRFGWTPNRASRLWETSPVIQQYARGVIPAPPRPWIQRPEPQGSRPLSLVPVDHDPFSGMLPPPAGPPAATGPPP
jgi:hypothetical protein